MKKILLASSSPRRTALLSQIGIKHEVMAPAIDESAFLGETPEDLVVILAVEKALNVASRVSDGLVIGADTVVILDKKVLGKPRDESEALDMLMRLQGQTHQVYTAVAVANAQTQAVSADFRKVDVTMASFTKEELQAYIATGEPLDKAGAYSIQGTGALLVQEIHGDYYAVVGLPLTLTLQLLTQNGYSSPLFN